MMRIIKSLLLAGGVVLASCGGKVQAPVSPSEDLIAWHNFAAAPVREKVTQGATATALVSLAVVSDNGGPELWRGRSGDPKEGSEVGPADLRIIEEAVRAGRFQVLASPKIMALPGEEASFAVERVYGAPSKGDEPAKEGYQIDLVCDLKGDEIHLTSLEVESRWRTGEEKAIHKVDFAPGFYQFPGPRRTSGAMEQEPTLLLVRVEAAE
jgi:hypothetical protein